MLALSTITTARGEDVHFLMHILAWMARYRTLRQGFSTRLKACLVVVSSSGAATTTLPCTLCKPESGEVLVDQNATYPLLGDYNGGSTPASESRHNCFHCGPPLCDGLPH